MSHITNEQRDAAYESATEAQKDFCGGTESGTYLRAVATKYQLPEEKYVPFVLIVGDTVLGLRNRKDLPQFLQSEASVSPEITLKITTDLLNFIDSKLSTSTSASETTPTIQRPSVHTMAGDVAKIQSKSETIHSSSQETLLNAR